MTLERFSPTLERFSPSVTARWLREGFRMPADHDLATGGAADKGRRPKASEEETRGLLAGFADYGDLIGGGVSEGRSGRRGHVSAGRL